MKRIKFLLKTLLLIPHLFFSPLCHAMPDTMPSSKQKLPYTQVKNNLSLTENQKNHTPPQITKIQNFFSSTLQSTKNKLNKTKDYIISLLPNHKISLPTTRAFPISHPTLKTNDTSSHLKQNTPTIIEHLTPHLDPLSLPYSANKEKIRELNNFFDQIIKDKEEKKDYLPFTEEDYKLSETDPKFSKIAGSFIGLMIGDALGMPVEFAKSAISPDGQLLGFYYQINPITQSPALITGPITDMIDGIYWMNLKKGQWTDDSSMALAIAESLIAHKGMNPNDILDRFICLAKGSYLSTIDKDEGRRKSFDIGNAVSSSIDYYLNHPHTPPLELGKAAKTSSGNGTIMRLAPIAIFYKDYINKAMEMAAQQAQITHGGSESIAAARYMVYLLVKAYNGATKEELLDPAPSTIDFGDSRVNDLARSKGNYDYKSIQNWKDMSYQGGYVMDTLKIALWSLHRNNDFKSSVLEACNANSTMNDADTVGAVTGQLAGALYGFHTIPQNWVDNLHKKDWLLGVFKKLYITSTESDIKQAPEKTSLPTPSLKNDEKELLPHTHEQHADNQNKLCIMPGMIF